MVFRFYRYIVLALILILAGIVIAIWQIPDRNLHLIACDVGQGDAILAVYKNIQILTDGGSDNAVLDCLGRHLPFWDREIELVVLTHPERDHYGGLIEVFRRYKVDNFLYNNVVSGSKGYQVLENAVGSSGARLINPIDSPGLRLEMMQLDILSPKQTESEVLGVQSDSGFNTLSIVTKLSLGSFDALLTGDAPPEVSDGLAQGSGINSVEYIKISHHGSKNGVTNNLLKAFDPKIAVISVGKNSYGHPHKEILDMLNKLGIRIFRTDEVGDVEVTTDGKAYWIKK